MATKRRLPRIHPLLRGHFTPRPTIHPGDPRVQPAPKPAVKPMRMPVPPVVEHGPNVPAIPASRQPGGGQGPPPPPPRTVTGTDPPATANGWLAGVGKEITPGPAMIAVSGLLGRTGIYAKAQSANTWARISHTRSTV